MNWDILKEEVVLPRMQTKIHIGTSGWSYDHWKEVFYEKRCPKSDLLKFYAKHPSWLEEKALFSLKKHNIAWFISDTAG
ncbi:MAG: hypothetical protein JRE10_04690 [Deltaproteobacteria bacterium]|nr:hypothetical protein [Deltaproteobacteria bacterium]